MTRGDHMGGVITALLIGWMIGAVTGGPLGRILEALFAAH